MTDFNLILTSKIRSYKLLESWNAVNTVGWEAARQLRIIGRYQGDQTGIITDNY